jgi:hypothetical protein
MRHTVKELSMPGTVRVMRDRKERQEYKQPNRQRDRPGDTDKKRQEYKEAERQATSRRTGKG